MPTSNANFRHLKLKFGGRRPLLILLSLLITAVLAVWYNQHGIERYWQQQYHRPSPLAALQQYPWWRLGDSHLPLAEELQETTQESVPEIMPEEALPVSAAAALETLPEHLYREADLLAGDVSLSAPNVDEDFAPAVAAPDFDNDLITLHRGDTVLFIGDSMMQTFAPPMQKWLKSEYDINSQNLSQHSTGLTNQSYHDWPATVEKAIPGIDNLSLVVILMGANDPWNIETADRRLLDFQSEAWEAEYGARALRIVRAAQEKGAAVVWIGLPPMRTPKYEDKIAYLDRLLSELLQDKTFYLSTRRLFADYGDGYRDSVQIDGRLERIRNQDGIHLSRQGDALILRALQAKIAIRR